jgi:SAM-dependent methyltransferase
MSTDSTAWAPYDYWADYYDLTDADRAPFIEFYRGLVTDETESLLELGCGTGTITIALAREIARRQEPSDAVRFVGVDESSRMLTVARARDARVDWMHGDIRSLPVDGSFDLVISCFNTLQHLLADGDLALAFREARRVLAPDGTFAFDMYRPNLDYLVTPQENRLARAVTDERGRRLQIREDTRYDADSRVLTIDWRLVEEGKEDVAPAAATRYHMRQYFPEDVDRLLTAADLVVTDRFGDFDRSSFVPTSKRQVVVCAAT